MTRLQQVDVDKSSQHLGHLLYHCTRQRRRTRSPRLARSQQQKWHATPNTGFQHPAGILGKTQRWYHKAARTTYERAFSPKFLATGD